MAIYKFEVNTPQGNKIYEASRVHTALHRAMERCENPKQGEEIHITVRNLGPVLREKRMFAFGDRVGLSGMAGEGLVGEVRRVGSYHAHFFYDVKVTEGLSYTIYRRRADQLVKVEVESP